MRRWFVYLAPLILLAHTLITACVSPSVLLLSQHEHWVIGKVSAAQWAAHTQWHLKQINGHFINSTTQAASDSVLTTGTIISAKGCDMQTLQAFYAALRSLPAAVWCGGDDVVVGNAPNLPQSQARLRALPVPLPPPRAD